MTTSKLHISFAEMELMAYLEGHEVPLLALTIFYSENTHASAMFSIPISEKMADFFDLVLKNRPLVTICARHRNETKFIGDDQEYVLFIGIVESYKFIITPNSMQLDLVAYDLSKLLTETTIYDLNPAMTWIDTAKIMSASQTTGHIDRFKEMVSQLITDGFKKSFESILSLFGLYSKESNEDIGGTEKTTEDINEEVRMKLESGGLEKLDQTEVGNGCDYNDSSKAIILEQRAADSWGGRTLVKYDSNGIRTSEITPDAKAAFRIFVKYGDDIQFASQITGVPQGILFGMLCREGANPNHPDGIMQITADSGYKYSYQSGFQDFKNAMAKKNIIVDVSDIAKDDRLSILCTAYMIKRTKDVTGDYRIAAMAYNGGELSTYRRIIVSAGGTPTDNLTEDKKTALEYLKNKKTNFCDVITKMSTGKVSTNSDAISRDKINASYVSMIFGKDGYINLWNYFVRNYKNVANKMGITEESPTSGTETSGPAETALVDDPYRETTNDWWGKIKEISKRKEGETEEEYKKRMMAFGVKIPTTEKPIEKETISLETVGKSNTNILSLNDVLEAMKTMDVCRTTIDITNTHDLYRIPDTKYDENRYGLVPMISEYRNFLIESIWIPEDTNTWRTYSAGYQLLVKNTPALMTESANIWQLIQFLLNLVSYQFVPIPGGALARPYISISKNSCGEYVYPILWAILPRITIVDFEEQCFAIPQQNIFYGTENPSSLSYSVNVIGRATALAGMLSAENMLLQGSGLTTMRIVMPPSLANDVQNSDWGDVAFRTIYTKEEEWRGPSRMFSKFDTLELGLSALEKIKAAENQGMTSGDTTNTVELEDYNISALMYLAAARDYFEGIVGNQTFSFSLSYWPYILVGLPAKFIAPSVNVYGIVSYVVFQWSSNGCSTQVVLRNAYTDWDEPKRAIALVGNIRPIDPWLTAQDFDNMRRFLVSIGSYDIDWNNSTEQEIKLIDSNDRGRHLLLKTSLSAKNLYNINRSPLRIRGAMNNMVKKYSRFLMGIGMGEAWELIGSIPSGEYGEPDWQDLESFTNT